MSASYACAGQMDRAVRAAQEGVAGCAEEDLVVRATGLLNLAGALCLRGDYVEAVERADDAIRVSQETGDRQRESEALIVRSESNLRRRRFHDAYVDAATARSFAEASRYRFAVAAAMWQQSKALAPLGRVREAAELRSRATEALQQLRGVFIDPLLTRLIEIADPQPSPPAQSPVGVA
jgi:tetratricopeptide (TPR) repeat protein